MEGTTGEYCWLARSSQAQLADRRVQRAVDGRLVEV